MHARALKAMQVGSIEDRLSEGLEGLLEAWQIGLEAGLAIRWAWACLLGLALSWVELGLNGPDLKIDKKKKHRQQNNKK